MAARFPVLQRTLDIDGALLEVYGMDQFGLDTAWRLALGLEPLPSPEELASELKEAAETPESDASPAEGSGVDELSGDTEANSPAGAETTAMPEATDGEDARPAGTTGDDPEGGSTSTGCSAPAAGAGGPTGLGMLLLLGAPLGLVAFPRLRRRWPFS